MKKFTLNVLMVLLIGGAAIFLYDHFIIQDSKTVLSDKLELKEEEKATPQKLASIQKELVHEEAKEIITELWEGVFDAYNDMGEQYQWSAGSNPPDFSILRPELLPFATTRFADGPLKESAEYFYCECDTPVFPIVDFDIRFTIHENSNNKLVISTIEFGDVINNRGSTAYFTAVKEDGNWLLDGLKVVDPDNEDMKVTEEEYRSYIQKTGMQANIINEVSQNGRKIYILAYEDARYFEGVYADSTEIVYDVPNEWLPEEYQKEATANLTGNWSIVEGFDGNLSINQTADDSFDFNLHVESGGHVGDIAGTSTIEGDTAYYNDAEGCILEFSISDDAIKINESFECTYWHGTAVAFNGTYYKE
ncbi:hypothetical protein [Planococcus sp. YIM B11945]|uniref:hypothetical protein n=1 Tax=Planococcus sp. YIM B11945 TaxID=3435410 RepID=UPI003D7E0F84